MERTKLFRSLYLIIYFICAVITTTLFCTELKDTPYFSGMPEYKITEAVDYEFSDYRFYNGKDCTAIEGEKYFRAYSLKEEGKQASELQIARNYLNAVKEMGGTILFDGVCSGAECAENCGYRMFHIDLSSLHIGIIIFIVKSSVLKTSKADPNKFVCYGYKSN